MALTYSSSDYDGLQSPATAGAKFEAISGSELIAIPFRELFLQHKVDRVICLALLHRHFDLAPKERLVEYRGTSTAWKVDNAADNLASHIGPSNWLLAEDGTFHPYEFDFLKDADRKLSPIVDPQYNDFIESFGNLLHQEDAAGLFGFISCAPFSVL
ncbi:hypothetical protein VE02_07712 [Pseudogymnoascus sp. 03VT05]|nr:hypothetical protein VE02_07712 [Pseudogymnoascus sp. 03VT05]